MSTGRQSIISRGFLPKQSLEDIRSTTMVATGLADVIKTEAEALVAVATHQLMTTVVSHGYKPSSDQPMHAHLSIIPDEEGWSIIAEIVQTKMESPE